MFITACLGNGIGIVLMLMVIVTNTGLYFTGTKNRNLSMMIMGTTISCVSDIIAFAVNGKSGRVMLFLNYTSNLWLYVAVIFVSYYWTKLLCECIGINILRREQWLIAGINLLGLLVAVLNLFFPLIFSLENNIYKRENFYYLYVVIGGINMLHGLILYYGTKRKGYLLNTFSVAIFVIPMILGTIVQSIFYGISVIWVGNAIAITGMVSSMKNELIYIDQMTGIYNRYYLEKIKKSATEKGSGKMTGIMTDLDRFKLINDQYGHEIGDEALIQTARIFTQAVGIYGKVIRYAGDEFVIILNLTEQEEVSRIIDKIRKGFEDFNASNPKGYQLSAAMGYDTFDLRKQSIDEFMNSIDAKMYEDKRRRREGKEA